MDLENIANNSRAPSRIEIEAKAHNLQAPLTECDTPFDGHPRARINDSKRACNFFYGGDPRKLESNGEARRQVYVLGVELGLFVSHALKDMMSECGDVDYITYLYGRPNNNGPAFVK